MGVGRAPPPPIPLATAPYVASRMRGRDRGDGAGVDASRPPRAALAAAGGGRALAARCPAPAQLVGDVVTGVLERFVQVDHLVRSAPLRLPRETRKLASVAHNAAI